MHHQFVFQNLQSVPYCMIRSGPDSMLLVIGIAMTAWMPADLREWLANAVARQMEGPPRRTAKIIDLTTVRALRAPIIIERKGEAHDPYPQEASGWCPSAAERPLPGPVSGHL